MTDQPRDPPPHGLPNVGRVWRQIEDLAWQECDPVVATPGDAEVNVASLPFRSVIDVYARALATGASTGITVRIYAVTEQCEALLDEGVTVAGRHRVVSARSRGCQRYEVRILRPPAFPIAPGKTEVRFTAFAWGHEPDACCSPRGLRHSRPDAGVLLASTIVTTAPEFLWGVAGYTTDPVVRFLQFFDQPTLPVGGEFPVIDRRIVAGPLDFEPAGDAPQLFPHGMVWALSTTPVVFTPGAAALAWVDVAHFPEGA